MGRQPNIHTNALTRGLRVLEAVNDLNDASVGALSRSSGVAKTTVLRILMTLEQAGYVVRDERHIYRVTDRVAALSRGLVDADRRERVVRPILGRLQDLRWPVEFLLAEGLSMVVAQNNRDRAPIKLSLFERHRFPMLQSAAGMAYLSALAEPERTSLMRAAAESGTTPKTALAAARRTLKRAIERGHAERDLDALEAGLRAVSVPVGRPRPFGALVLILFHDMVSAETLRRKIIPRLKAAAGEIDAAVGRPDSREDTTA